MARRKTKRTETTNDAAMSCVHAMLPAKYRAIQHQIHDLLVQHGEYYATMQGHTRLGDEDMSQQLEARNRTRMMLLETAFLRLEEEAYDLCQDCGSAIGRTGLKAFPFAQR